MLPSRGQGAGDRVMRIAAYSIGKWHHVGIVDRDGRSIQPFDLSASDAARGVLCIIDLKVRSV